MHWKSHIYHLYIWETLLQLVSRNAREFKNNITEILPIDLTIFRITSYIHNMIVWFKHCTNSSQSIFFLYVICFHSIIQINCNLWYLPLYGSLYLCILPLRNGIKYGYPDWISLIGYFLLYIKHFDYLLLMSNILLCSA